MEGLVLRLVNEGLLVLVFRLFFLVRWFLKEEVFCILLLLFKLWYLKCRVIIDCIEIFCERVCNLILWVFIWFNYKYYNIIKILVGIILSGVIFFVLKVFGGRVLDKLII